MIEKKKPKSKSLLIFAGGVAVALLIVFIVNLLGDDDPDDFGRDPVTVVDEKRLAQTYEAGKTYVTMGTVQVASRGSHKDWGIEKVVNFQYFGDFQVSREILSNDGKTIVAKVRVDRATTIKCFTEVEAVDLNLGPQFETFLVLGSLAFDPTGMTTSQIQIGKETLGQILNSKVAKDHFSKVAQDKSAKVFASVDELEGKTVKVTFGNGIGVTGVEPIDCTLTPDNQLFFEQLSMITDLTVMKDLDCKPGDTWEVKGKDFISVMDPSMNMDTQGSVTVRRGEDIDAGDQGQAKLSIAGGVLNFLDRYDGEKHKMQRNASWAPKGDLIFDFGQKIVSEGRLTGAVDMVEESTDHILFQMKHALQPQYEVKYSAWILDGAMKAVDEMIPQIKEGTLDKLKDRIDSL